MSDIKNIYPSEIPKLAIERSARDDSIKSGNFSLSFKDVFDTINPLQQLPIVSSLYRESTGDNISSLARLAGGAIMGGPLGFAIAAVNVGIEAITGDDVSGHLFAFLDEATNPAKAADSYSKAYKLA